MANETNTHVKQNEPLHEVMDLVKATMDKADRAISSIDETRTQLAEDQKQVRAEWEETRERMSEWDRRLDEMDKKQERGRKLYVPPNGDSLYSEGRQELGKFLSDLYCGARGQKPLYDYWHRAQTEGTNADGGFLVPVEILPEVNRIIETYGFARQNCRILPMNRQTMQVPTSLAGPTVGFPGENTAPSATSATFARPELVAKQLLAWDQISLELDEDALPMFSQFLIDIFAQTAAGVEDVQALNTSNNPFTGVLHEAGVGEITLGTGSVSFHQLNHNAIVDTFDAASEFTQETGVWVMSAYVANMIRKLLDSNGQPLLAPMSAAGPPFLLGRPVKLNAKMPKKANSTAATTFLAFGDFRYELFGDRRMPSFEFSEHVAFTSGALVLRFRERFAIKVVQAAAFSRLKTAAS